MNKIDWTKPLEVYLYSKTGWWPAKVIYEYRLTDGGMKVVSVVTTDGEMILSIKADSANIRNRPVPMIEKTVYTSVWAHPAHTWSIANVNKYLYDKTVEYYKRQNYTCLGEFTNVVVSPDPEAK